MRHIIFIVTAMLFFFGISPDMSAQTHPSVNMFRPNSFYLRDFVLKTGKPSQNGYKTIYIKYQEGTCAVHCDATNATAPIQLMMVIPPDESGYATYITGALAPTTVVTQATLPDAVAFGLSNPFKQ